MTTLFHMSGPFAEARQKEFRFCIEKNLVNPNVDRFLVIWEKSSEMPYPDSRYSFLDNLKVTIFPHDRRPTYDDFMALAVDQNLTGPVGIINTDIFFDESLSLAENIPADTIYSISRYNWDPDNESATSLQGDGRSGSSDTWIWRAPLKTFKADIILGVIGCDSYFVQRALGASLKVLNPCLSVRSYHLHKVGIRNDSPSGLRYWDARDYSITCIDPCKI